MSEELLEKTNQNVAAGRIKKKKKSGSSGSGTNRNGVVEEIVDGNISPIMGAETFLNLSGVTSEMEEDRHEVQNQRPVAQSQQMIPVQQVLRGQQPYILEKSNFTLEHIRKLEHYVMMEKNDGRTPDMKALIPETNRMVILQMLIMAQAGDRTLHDD